MYGFCLGCIGMVPQEEHAGKSQSVHRHLQESFVFCFAALKECKGLLTPHKLHFLHFALIGMSASQFPHLAKCSVEVLSHALNSVVLNLCGCSSLLHPLHLYRLCFHTFVRAFLSPGGNVAQQALQCASSVRRSASKHFNGNILPRHLPCRCPFPRDT